jgi:hypothetical protein
VPSTSETLGEQVWHEPQTGQLTDIDALHRQIKRDRSAEAGAYPWRWCKNGFHRRAARVTAS